MLHLAAPEGPWLERVRWGREGFLAPGRQPHRPVRRWTLDSAQGLTKECCLGCFLEPCTPVGPSSHQALAGGRKHSPVGEALSEDGGAPADGGQWLCAPQGGKVDALPQSKARAGSPSPERGCTHP